MHLALYMHIFKVQRKNYTRHCLHPFVYLNSYTIRMTIPPQTKTAGSSLQQYICDEARMLTIEPEGDLKS